MTQHTDAAPNRDDLTPAMRQAITAAVDAQLAALERGEDDEAALAAADAVLRESNLFPPRIAPVSGTRVDGCTVATQRAFVLALAETGCVSRAASAAGVARSTVYALRTREPHSMFAFAWDVAAAVGRKRLLDVAMERALEGQEVPVWHRGEQVGTRTVYNDRLLTFLLSYKPEPVHPVLASADLVALFPRFVGAVGHPMPDRAAALAEELGLTA